MASRHPGSRFHAAYQTLPPEARSILLDQLVNTLGEVSDPTCKKVLKLATQKKSQYSNVPSLDELFRIKQLEIDNLLIELALSTKLRLTHSHSAHKLFSDGSRKDQLVEEILHTLIKWIEQLWAVTYEFGAYFSAAQRSLRYMMQIMAKLRTPHYIGTGCHCNMKRILVNAVFATTGPRIVQKFNFVGAHHMERVMYWVWREVLICTIASDDDTAISEISNVMEGIETDLGWGGLVSLLDGGKTPPLGYSGEEEEEEEEENMDEEDELYSSDDEPTDDEDDTDETHNEGDFRFTPDCIFHGSHWSLSMQQHAIAFSVIVQVQLFNIFKHSPSLGLFVVLRSICFDSESAVTQLYSILDQYGYSSSESFTAMLSIFIGRRLHEKVATSLASHSHLLRPCDAPIYQTATKMLYETNLFKPQAIMTLQRELFDTGNAMRHAIFAAFKFINHPANVSELTSIAKLKPGSQSRLDRIEKWIDATITPASHVPQSMAFAALVMGLPLPGMGMNEPADPLDYPHIDLDDPDLFDLKQQWRPNLKERFEGWLGVGLSMRGGANVLLKLYLELVNTMPFIRMPDVMHEMGHRLSPRSNCDHIIEALNSLANFSKTQSKKFYQQQQKKDPAKSSAPQPSVKPKTSMPSLIPVTDNQASSSSSSAPDNLPTVSPSVSSLPFPGPGFFSFSSAFSDHNGGLDDVD